MTCRMFVPGALAKEKTVSASEPLGHTDCVTNMKDVLPRTSRLYLWRCYLLTSSLCCSPILVLLEGRLFSVRPLSCTIFFAKLNTSVCSALSQKLNINLSLNYGNSLCYDIIR